MVQAQLRDMQLPQQARERIESHRDIQKVQRPHDIRNAIPKVAWTDPANFPPYVFREYPKMPLLDGNTPIKINESGDLLMFFNKEDEEEFMDLNPDLAEEIERNTPATIAANAIAAKDDEIAELRRMLQEAGIEPNAKKKSIYSGGLAGAIRSAPAEAAPESDDVPAEDLRSQVKAAEKKNGNPLKKK